MEAVWPGLYVDKAGNYWDVPFLVAVDLASVASTSGASYHLSLLHNLGSPERFNGDGSDQVPTSLLPGLTLKGAFALKRNIEFWRSTTPKLKMVQPFDIFLSNPHVSASGIIGKLLPPFSAFAELMSFSRRTNADTLFSICITLVGLSF